MLPYLEHRSRFHWHIMLLTSRNYPNWIHQKHHLHSYHVALFWLACCSSAIVFGKHFQACLQILETNHYHNTLPILHCSTFHNCPFCLHLYRCGNLSILKWVEACNDIQLQIMIAKCYKYEWLFKCYLLGQVGNPGHGFVSCQSFCPFESETWFPRHSFNPP